MTDLAKNLADLAAKATPGPWEIDSEYDDDAHYSGGGGCGRGFKNFFIGAPVDGKWRTLLDSANSDHKLVDEDFDEDGRSAWDNIGLANASLTIELVNNLPAIIAALTAQADHDKVLAERDALAAKLSQAWKAEGDVVAQMAAAEITTERNNALEAENARLRAALELFQSFGCPVCSGDCGSANPPVVTCPMQTARAALEAEP